MEDRIRLTIVNGIADVRLNHAAKMNALDPAMFRAIAGSDAQFKDGRGLRAVVLSGEGRAFCASLDFERVAAVAGGSSLLPFADLAERTHGICNWAQPIIWLWRECPRPSSPRCMGRLRRQLPTRPWRRSALRRAGHASLDYGNQMGLGAGNGRNPAQPLARDDVVRELTYTARIFSADEAPGMRWRRKVSKLS